VPCTVPAYAFQPHPHLTLTLTLPLPYPRSDWYNGRGTGPNVTVDARGPNGDGALGPATKEGGWANCEAGF
jgi:hypothetical protein